MPDKAERICKALKVNYDDYLETQTDSHPYAKESIMKFKRVLSTVLATAKRQRLVEHNFASSEYIVPIKGNKTEVKILNDKEAKVLSQALDKE